jgi:hypothetical protein
MGIGRLEHWFTLHSSPKSPPPKLHKPEIHNREQGEAEQPTGHHRGKIT